MTDHYLKFRYTNWRGKRYEYVIDPEPVPKFDYYGSDGKGGNTRSWTLSGLVVTRDGDPRPDMGPTRRRTFQMSKMEDVQEIKPELTLGGAAIKLRNHVDELRRLGYAVGAYDDVLIVSDLDGRSVHVPQTEHAVGIRGVIMWATE